MANIKDIIVAHIHLVPAGKTIQVPRANLRWELPDGDWKKICTVNKLYNAGSMVWE